MDGPGSSTEGLSTSQRHLAKGSEWLPLGCTRDYAALEERMVKISLRLGELELLVAKLSVQQAGALPDGAGQWEPPASSQHLSTVKAACHDLRRSPGEAYRLLEAMERLLRQELHEAAGKLRQDLELHSAWMRWNAAELARVDAAGAQLVRRVEDAEGQLRGLRLYHASETAAFKGRLEVSVRECDQAPKVEELLMAVKAEVAREVGQLWERLRMESAKVEQNALGDGRVGAAGAELSRGLREGDRKLTEFEQALQRQSTETADARSRLDVATREGNVLLQVESDQRMSEGSALLARVEVVEQAAQAAGEVHTAKLLSRLEKLEKLFPDAQQHAEEMARLTKRLETIEIQFAAVLQARTPEAVRLAFLSDEVDRLRGRVEAVEKRGRLAAEQKKAVSFAAPAAAAAAPSDVDGLWSVLAATSDEVACLARHLTAVQEEHSAAITGIAGLTEFVGKAAVTSIRRSEDRLTEESGAKREELKKAAADILRESLALKSQASVQGAPAATGVPRSEGSALQAAGSVRLSTVAPQLHREAAVQAANAEARTVAPETAIAADLQCARGQLESPKLEVRDPLPRLVAWETAVAVAGRHRVPQQRGGATRVHAAPTPQQRSPRARRQSASPAEADAAGASPLSKGSGAFPASPVLLPFDIFTPRQSSAESAQCQPQGLLRQVEGIISSVHRTLGTLSAEVWPAGPAGGPGQAPPLSIAEGPSFPTAAGQQPAPPSAPPAAQRGGP